MKDIGADSEILELAIAREQHAHQFFLALAERVTDPKMCKVFEELAQEELEHKEKLELEAMKQGIVVNIESPTNDFDRSQYVISDTPELDIDYKDMLLLGIEKENASFRFYVEMVSQARNQDSREILLALAEEEVKHKLRFQTEYDYYLKSIDNQD